MDPGGSGSDCASSYEEAYHCWPFSIHIIVRPLIGSPFPCLVVRFMVLLTNNGPHDSCNATIFLLIYYLPIYFQAAQGVSPSTSGIRCLPMILAMSIALLASSALVTWIGYFQPLLLAGGVLLTVGSGLIITLDIDSSAWKYIGYQILVGVGNGISSQIPLIASLAFAAPEDIALTTALVLCTNCLP